ncbi:MMS19 nucleotide excision repair protein homolog [Xenia sp. Carnegie-2017]|uniref:MMS19 nucleotide excision repair protein homolog n=1 Tax=Xenia sp. Carnegie-2017 TaxID=2897299 RepID=UPI001F0377D8|nr:MMS19 nucleotide excision repair protein homolog [Xenia sp. Carnegie-2017]
MLFTVLLEKKMTELQTLGTDFVFGYIQAMDGEKDPRNLLVCFELVQIIVKRFPIDIHGSRTVRRGSLLGGDSEYYAKYCFGRKGTVVFPVMKNIIFLLINMLTITF